MKSYFKKSIINIFLDIKTLIDHIINDNIILYIKESEYIYCINQLYIILIDTLKKIEGLYYDHILAHKLNTYYQSGLHKIDSVNSIISMDDNSHNNLYIPPYYNIIISTIIYKIIQL